MTQLRHAKYKRQPHAFSNHRITPCSLEIIRTLARYRFLSTSLITALVGGNERNVKRQLQWLWHAGYINRFAFPSIVGSSEFVYFLDNVHSLDLLTASSGFEITEELRNEIHGHREKKYYLISDPQFSIENQGRLMFVQHERMIAALHANLTLACRESEGRCRLSAWAQGPSLYSSVNIIAVPRNGDARGKEQQTVRLPLRPDALFTLETTTGDTKRRFHYCYEADRKTMPMSKMKEKFRAYVHFLRQQRHRAAWGVDSIRAVLVETLDAPHAHMLLNAVSEPSVCGDRPNGLFWFTTSRADSKEQSSSGAAEGLVRALTSAQSILKRIWASSKDRFHSLTEE